MRQLKRPVVLGVGTVLLLLLGLIYAYSVLLAPLKAEYGWPVSGMTSIFALSICAFTVGGLLSGKLVGMKQTRGGLLLGAAFLLAGFLGVSRCPTEGSLPFVAVMYGILASFGIGIAYNIVIPVVSAWFPDKPGFAQGACLMGFGMGGFLFGPLVTGLYGTFPWRGVLALVGVVFACLTAASSLVIRIPSREEICLPLGGLERADAGGGESSVRRVLASPIFYLEFLFLFFMGSNGMGVTGIGRELPLALGLDDMAAAFVIGFVNIGSGIGRLGGGILLDRAGCERSMLGIASLAVAASVLMSASLLLGSVAIQTVACLACGVAWGSGIVTMPFITRREWGQEGLAGNMALVNTYSIFGALAGSLGSGLVVEATGSFYPVFGTMFVFASAALLVAWRMKCLRGRSRA